MKNSSFWHNVRQRFSQNHKDILSFVLVAVIAVAVFIFVSVFPHLGVILFALILSVFFIVAWVMAGIAVFRSLIAASVGLSFILFIAQSYCLSPALHSGDDSLKSLFAFGLIYVLVIFVKSIWNELFGNEKNKGTIKIFQEHYGGKHSWLLLTLYGLSIGLFLMQLYQIMIPIVRGLCIYSH